MKVLIGADHGGFRLKEELKKKMSGYEWIDVGTFSEESCDYPDVAKELCGRLKKGEAERGILICGTGVGMSMAANRAPGIRAACVSDTFSAKYTRLHNDANVLCMGERVVGPGLAQMLAEIFLTTEFEGGRHERRVNKLTELEKGEN